MFAETSEHQIQYAHDGYAVVDLFTADEVAQLLEIWCSESPGLPGLPFVATIMSPDSAHRRAVDAALREICAPAVERFWPGAQLVLCQINDKRSAGDPSVVGLHQDWSITDESQFKAIGLFCPLVDVDHHNGALFAVPGTHLLPSIPRSMYDVQPYPELTDAFMREAEVLPMAAGQACAHELMVFHGSVPNRTEHSRPAVGLLLAERGAPLRHYVRDGSTLTEFEMDAEQFLSLQYGAQPQFGAPLSSMERKPLPLNASDISAAVRASREASAVG